MTRDDLLKAMRPAIGLAGLFALALVVAACGEDEASSASDGGRYVYVSGVRQDAAYQAIACGVKAEAKKLGVEADVQDPAEFTPAAQIPVLNAVVNGGADGVIISPNDAKALFAPIAKAEGQDVPVVTALNTLEDAEPLAAEVVAEEVEGGRQAVRFIAEQAGERSGKVAVVSFKPGASVPTDLRLQGIEEEIENHPNLNYVGAQFVNDVEAQSATVKTNAILARDPDLLGLVATFGIAGDGAAAAIRARGPNGLIAVTYDVTQESTRKNLQRGDIEAIIDYQQEDLGAAALEQAVNAASGESVKEETVLPPIVYTKHDLKRDQDIPSPDC